MAELKTLTNQRNSIKAKLSFFESFIASLGAVYSDGVINDQKTMIELEQRLERNSKLLDDYDAIQLLIDALGENLEQELAERESFESAFFSAIAKAKTYIVKNSHLLDNVITVGSVIKEPSEASVSVRSTNISAFKAIKLPTIQLPKFSGELNKWLEFRDTFNSLIDQNDSITNIQKFHYLRSSLGGPALQIITNLEFSTKNYAIAWNLVCTRYNNSRILIQNHIKSLFNLEKIHEESSKHLRKIVEDVATHLRALDILEEPTSNWDTLIIYLISTKLDSTTLREWEEIKSKFEKPNLENLNEFLNNRADLLESLESNKSAKKLSKLRHDDKTRSFVTAKVLCSYCKGSHYIQNCPEFSKLTVKERIDKAKHNRLCINCLRPGHMVKQCRSSSCKTCNCRHNSLLHLENETVTPKVNEGETINLSARSINNSQVLLSTAIVRIYDKNNKPVLARALLDAVHKAVS